MAIVKVTNRPYTNSTLIGSLVCRTPIIPVKESDRCKLVTTKSELVSVFGDPYISPSDYADLLLAYDLVSRNVPVYISCIYDMHDNDDGFPFKYNGYTELNIKDEYAHTKLTLQLKSNIKFCQPIISTKCTNNRLIVTASLYLLDRRTVKTYKQINEFDNKFLYRTSTLSFNLDAVTDKDVIDQLKLINIYVRVNSDIENVLVNTLKQFSEFKVLVSECNTPYYSYNINSDNYYYEFEDTIAIIDEYNHAIDNLLKCKPMPHTLSIGKLYSSVKSINHEHVDGKEQQFVAYSDMVDLDPISYFAVQSHLLSRVPDSESEVYIFINMPDTTVSSAIDLLESSNNFEDSLSLPDQYNCDLCFGCTTKYVNSSLYYSNPTRVNYPLSLLAMFNITLNQTMYLSNNVSGLNISNASIKSIITESSAKSLLNNRCNSIVNFDIGIPSFYGDRSLSTSPNLRYSHVSRHFIYIRRLIKEFLELQKFKINSIYNAQSYLDYINNDILSTFLNSGVLSDYTSSYSIFNNTVAINIELMFNNVIDSIELNFTI